MATLHNVRPHRYPYLDDSFARARSRAYKIFLSMIVLYAVIIFTIVLMAHGLIVCTDAGSVPASYAQISRAGDWLLQA